MIEAEEVLRKTGYSRPHTAHCGPDGIYINALGDGEGNGPGGIFVLDPETFEIRGRWEKDRGPQHLAYDFWWHLGHDTMITSEWGTPKMVEDGVNPELLLGGKYGHALHVWDLHTRPHLQKLELGPEYQMVLELGPAHDPHRGLRLRRGGHQPRRICRPRSGCGTGTVTGAWNVRKVIEIPAEPADAADLPPLLKGFGAVPPLVTDINLSLDDRFLYVSCWGTGELKQYDVSDPFNPVETGSVRLGGIVGRTAHPGRPGQSLNGAPQMVEVSRDGRRVYVTNSLYRPGTSSSIPDGIRGWLAKVDVNPTGGIQLDSDLFARVRRACARTRCAWMAATPLRLLLLRVRWAMHGEMTSSSGDAGGARAPFTASTREWDGSSRWRSACRSAAAGRWCGRWCRSARGTRWRWRRRWRWPLSWAPPSRSAGCARWWGAS